MRFLVQRAARASVTIDGVVTGKIGRGLVLLVGLGAGDNEALFAPAIDKLLNLRIFNDDEGKMNRSLLDVGGGLLVISQFTLYADARKGRRPSYIDAMPPAQADLLFAKFVAALRGTFTGPVEEGRFGAHMEVDLVNEGPVTIWLDSAEMGWGARTNP
jgi:D-tyrosyl-tRNA(Tyr) deacylase